MHDPVPISEVPSWRLRARASLTRAVIALAIVTAVVTAFGCGDDDPKDDSPVVTAPAPGPFRGGRLPGPLDRAPAPHFRLPDARGGEVDTRDLAGRPYMVTFLYTRCRDICLTIGQEIGQALRQLGPRERAVALAVSVDPEGDTPARVRRWLREQRLPPSFRYLIGTRRQLQPVWKSYYAASQPRHSHESRHTTSIWLIDGRGRLRTKFSAGVPVPPADIAHDLRLLAREGGGS
jgi:cytochrome oxidase Cu insertion factor (SCO1/SenC/PrrC family)